MSSVVDDVVEDREGRAVGTMPRRRNNALQSFSRYYTLAIEMAIAVIAPLLLGRWLDARTGKDPWFTIAGMILGGAAAIRSAHRAISESLKSLERDRELSEEDAPTRRSEQGGSSV